MLRIRLPSVGRRRVSASADIVVGLGWGDESKGATVDALVAHTQAKRVVRFNGGQQAAHNVIANGVHHTFANFGSGTISGVPTWISHYCTIDPIAIWNEKSALLKLGFKPVLNVDSKALVTTALHVLANHIRETHRGENNHGTTGTGFGETIAYSLENGQAMRVEDLKDYSTVAMKLMDIRDFYVNEGLFDGKHTNLQNSKMRSLAGVMTTYAKHFNIVKTEQLLEAINDGHTIFEGAQGFMLDENFGFAPHTTWSTTTPSNARELLRAAGVQDVRAIGAIRSYATRHGAGPLPHDGELDFEPEECHNSSENMQGLFRTAPHDPEMIEWAIDTTMVDALAVSHLDVFDGFQTNHGLFPLDTFGKPVVMKAWGPAREDRLVI